MRGVTLAATVGNAGRANAKFHSHVHHKPVQGCVCGFDVATLPAGLSINRLTETNARTECAQTAPSHPIVAPCNLPFWLRSPGSKTSQQSLLEVLKCFNGLRTALCQMPWMELSAEVKRPSVLLRQHEATFLKDILHLDPKSYLLHPGSRRPRAPAHSCAYMLLRGASPSLRT